jgi:hypothetical protein
LWHKIATALSQPVYTIRDSMPYKEFLDWGAYFELEREDYSQTDVNIAQLSCLVHNYLCKSKIKIQDLLPTSKKREKKTPAEVSVDIKNLFKIINR